MTELKGTFWVDETRHGDFTGNEGELVRFEQNDHQIRMTFGDPAKEQVSDVLIEIQPEGVVLYLHDGKNEEPTRFVLPRYSETANAG